MSIVYDKTMKLELWVIDSGVFDGFAVFVNGALFDQVGDQNTRKYAIDVPDAAEPIVIHFGGNDGGASAIVDVAGGGQKSVEKQTGLRHSYIILPPGVA